MKGSSRRKKLGVDRSIRTVSDADLIHARAILVSRVPGMVTGYFAVFSINLNGEWRQLSKEHPFIVANRLKDSFLQRQQALKNNTQRIEA